MKNRRTPLARLSHRGLSARVLRRRLPSTERVERRRVPPEHLPAMRRPKSSAAREIENDSTIDRFRRDNRHAALLNIHENVTPPTTPPDASPPADMPPPKWQKTLYVPNATQRRAGVRRVRRHVQRTREQTYALRIAVDSDAATLPRF